MADNNEPKVFHRDEVFEKAAFANLNQAELNRYEMNLKDYRDYKNSIDTAFDEGKTDVARKLLGKGMSVEFVVEVTGLAKEIIEKL